MKHFIGGSAAGWIISLIVLPKTTGIKTLDYTIAFIAHAFFSILFGLAAWGLLS